MKIKQWCRVVMNETTERLVQSLNPSKLDVLEVSGDAWKSTGFKSYVSVRWPQFDICQDRTRRTFDLIIAEQVLEHVRRPDHALRNMLGMLRQGGSVLITTPFLIEYHPEPLDLWRWTATGLQALLEDNGFKVLTAGSWGNKACVVENLGHWPDYDPALHSLENEPRYPIVVWVFGKRDRPQSPADRFTAYLKSAQRLNRLRKRPIFNLSN
jgi:SAM-dependent methyltransferase